MIGVIGGISLAMMLAKTPVASAIRMLTAMVKPNSTTG